LVVGDYIYNIDFEYLRNQQQISLTKVICSIEKAFEKQVIFGLQEGKKKCTSIDKAYINSKG